MRHFHNHHHDHGHPFARHGFGWGGRGERGGMGRHGRPERVFEQGDLRLVLLKLIADQPRHGYELIKAVEDSVGGAYSPSPGVVYPTLTLLEELGYATAQEGAGKKLYTITPAGQAFLDSQATTVSALFARIAEVATANRGRRSPQVMRAMENLRTALKLRLSGGPLDEDQVRAVAAALDAAAKAVEEA
jgi:DNA-binding PadR family transcriptional regulator